MAAYRIVQLRIIFMIINFLFILKICLIEIFVIIMFVLCWVVVRRGGIKVARGGPSLARLEVNILLRVTATEEKEVKG